MEDEGNSDANKSSKGNREGVDEAVRSLGVLFRKMPFHVQSEMVASSEGTLANGTLEGFRASMFPIVTSQFVASGEPPFAFRPLTLVRFFTCVYPLVRLQVRTLRVDLCTTYKITVVDSSLLELGIVPSVEFGGDGRRLNPV